MNQFKLLSACMLMVFFIVGCGTSVQPLNDGQTASDDTDITSETDNRSDTQMLVEVTPDNFGDYFEFVLIDTGSIDKTTSTPNLTFVPKIKVFDDGWVYLETSHDFSITYTMSKSHEDSIALGYLDYFTQGDIGKIKYFCTEAEEPEFKIIDVQGQILFEHMEALQQYDIDSFKLLRVVVSSEGKRYATQLFKEQLDLQY